MSPREEYDDKEGKFHEISLLSNIQDEDIVINCTNNMEMMKNRKSFKFSNKKMNGKNILEDDSASIPKDLTKNIFS